MQQSLIFLDKYLLKENISVLPVRIKQVVNAAASIPVANYIVFRCKSYEVFVGQIDVVSVVGKLANNFDRQKLLNCFD